MIAFDLGIFPGALEFIVDERRLILDKTWDHLLLSAAGMGIALAIALPLGLWLGHLHRGSFVAVNVANIGRALPSLAVIAIGIAFLGVGFTNIALALVVLAVPPILTNAYVAVDGVEADAVEAARGMGMTGWQIVWKVELPLALPLIFAGIRTAVVFVIATATIAAVAGGGGLGDIIVNQAAVRARGRRRGGDLRVGARARGGCAPRARPAPADARGPAHAHACPRARRSDGDIA